MTRPGQIARVKVTIAMRPGMVTPAQRQIWKQFWQKLISEVKADENHNQLRR